MFREEKNTKYQQLKTSAQNRVRARKENEEKEENFETDDEECEIWERKTSKKKRVEKGSKENVNNPKGFLWKLIVFVQQEHRELFQGIRSSVERT